MDRASLRRPWGPRGNVGLLVLPRLKAVLHQAQEAVRLGEFGDGLRGEQVQGPETIEHRQNGADLQGPVASAAHQLQGLADELDLADAPRAELDVGVHPLAVELLGDQSLESRSDSMAP